MRKIIKTKWGLEIIYSQEKWFTASYLELGVGKKTPDRTAPFDIVYDIMDGTVRFIINGRTYEFSKGKTVSIKKGTKYQIVGVVSPRLNKIARTKIEDEDLSPY